MSDGYWVCEVHCSVSLTFVKQKCPQLKNNTSFILMRTFICGYVTFSFDFTELFGRPVVKDTMNLR